MDIEYSEDIMRLNWEDIGYSVLYGVLGGFISAWLCIRIIKILMISSNKLILLFIILSFSIPFLIGGYLIYWYLHKDDDIYADRDLFKIMMVTEHKGLDKGKED